MSSIFLSHSSRDNVITEQVTTRLKEWGHRSVFLDFDPEHGIPGGRDWEKELYANLRECRAVIVLCSCASMASRWCFAEMVHAKALGKDVFPIKIDDCTVDPILTGNQVIDATANWDQAYQRLANGLLKAGLDPKGLFDWDGVRPPYPGLPAFQEQDAAIFFGRDKEIREGQALLNRLQQFGGPRLTLMLGASGSGKSSLMRAGLLPRLKRDQRWVVIDPFRPLNHPFDELAMVLSQRFSQNKQAGMATPTEAAHVRGLIQWNDQDTRKSVDTFLGWLKELRETVGLREATVLLLIDQCEELLSVGANEEGERFLTFLRALLDREDSRLMVLATLRSDFLGSFQDHPTMRGLRVEPCVVPQMEVESFVSVIEGPARIAGLELGPGLVQAMVNDTKTSDALPLLAFTLRELYEGFGEDKRLTLEEYRDQLGRIDGCIARVAEAVLGAMPLLEKEVSDLRTAFLGMMRVADNEHYAKQPVQWNDLPASIQHVLERFVTARLLISGGDTNGRTLEVAHEALFRSWPRLVGWLKDNHAFLVWQQRLNTMMKEWNKNRQSPDLLLRGLPLREGLDWLQKKPDSLSAPECLFVMASQNRRTRERMVAFTGASLVLLLIGGMTWLWQKGYTVDQAEQKIQSVFVSIHVSPQMVQLPGGSFQQGDMEGIGESVEKPVRSVTIKPFAMGTYEVTFNEYDRFAITTGRPLPGDQGWGRDRRPVIDVSWDDAKAYAKWLSQETGKGYRLPTESEWEYAARSGAKQEIVAGTSNLAQIGEYAVFLENSGNRTADVGTKKANGFGLYDLSGNVFEWVEDCAHRTYKQAPTDGSAWLEADGGDCSRHMIRGGSWIDRSVFLRATNRTWDGLADYRSLNIGFRLVQDIEP